MGRILYKSAPLPFQGQKRNFVSVLEKFLCGGCSNDLFVSGVGSLSSARWVIVDLFGGSGLLSDICKRYRPDCRVIYNDYDGYMVRLSHIDETNALLRLIYGIVNNGVSVKDRLPSDKRIAVLDVVRDWELRYGYVDYITLSSNLLFSGRSVSSYDELLGVTMYNRVVSRPYIRGSYLEGVEIVYDDYKALIERYKGLSNVLFMVDPPYFNTSDGHYSVSWDIWEYLSVLGDLMESGCPYIFFSCVRSRLDNFCRLIKRYKSIGSFLDDVTCYASHRHYCAGGRSSEDLMYISNSLYE